MIQPSISVLIPVHNAELYLAFALDSILRQSYQDFEVIAINDGSVDLSGEILDDYANRFTNFRVFHRPQRGLVITLNEGIELARGTWIARMDADDISLSNRFELQLNYLITNSADFCGGSVEYFGDSRSIIRYPDSNECCGVQMLFSSPFAHPAVMGRTSAFESLLYDINFNHAEDYDLWQRAWASSYRFTNVNDVILRYRVHARQISYVQNLKQSETAIIVRARHWKHYFPQLDYQAINHIISAFNCVEDDSSKFAKTLIDLLPSVPESSRQIYIEGSLRLLIRVAGRDSNVLIHWLKLTASIPHSCRLKLFGIAILLSLVLCRGNPKSPIFSLLRIVKKMI